MLSHLFGQIWLLFKYSLPYLIGLISNELYLKIMFYIFIHVCGIMSDSSLNPSLNHIFGATTILA